MKTTPMKNMAIAVVIILFAITWIRSLPRQPVDVGQKLETMRQPIDVLIKSGGVVFNNHEKIRANIALIYANLDATFWNLPVLEKYKNEIRKNGWAIIDDQSGVVKYCKNSILLIFPNNFEGSGGEGRLRSDLMLIVQYSAASIEQCGRLAQ
jgi:hypothetical protein